MSEKFSIPYRTYQGYEREERSIPHGILAQIVQTLGLSYDYIYNGKGHVTNEVQANNDVISVPIRGNVEASLGSGMTVYDESVTKTYSIDKKLAAELDINPKTAEIIYSRGDSMEPTIMGGDSLLVDLSKTCIIDGVIYCIRLDGQLLTKRLQKIAKNVVGIVSDNPKYKMRELKLDDETEDFKIIGEVKWWGRIAK